MSTPISGITNVLERSRVRAALVGLCPTWLQPSTLGTWTDQTFHIGNPSEIEGGFWLARLLAHAKGTTGLLFVWSRRRREKGCWADGEGTSQGGRGYRESGVETALNRAACFPDRLAEKHRGVPNTIRTLPALQCTKPKAATNGRPCSAPKEG